MPSMPTEGAEDKNHWSPEAEGLLVRSTDLRLNPSLQGGNQKDKYY